MTGDRVASLDAFRGFTIASMVLVNNPGDWAHLHAQLAHANWNGWTFTDWVFPFFLFIGGVASTISLGRRAKTRPDKEALLAGLAKRAAIIFALGFLLNLVPTFDFAHVRVLGVLQRIAICTMCAAPIVLWLDWRGCLAAAVGLLALYTFMLFAVPVPDPDGVVVRGALEPGRDVGAYVDRLLLGGHLWSTSKTWDPEGLVSTIPAIASQLSGVLAGKWLFSARPPQVKARGMVGGGIGLVFVGHALAIVIPINKSLWTPSYVLVTTGFALLVFAFFYLTMDMARAARHFLPFNIYGMNALFIFAFSGLVAKMLGFIKLAEGHSLKTTLYAPIRALPLAPENTSLVFAILFDLAMFAVAWGMWKKKWFVKV
jgi:predicted acyltransferase